MGLFSRKTKETEWQVAPSVAAKPTQSAFGYEDSAAFTNNANIEGIEGVSPHCFISDISEILKLVPAAQKEIPSFQTSKKLGYMRIGKTAENKGKSQPYKDRIQLVTESDVFHIWYYPSGKIWKCECWFWPQGGAGFMLIGRRPNNDEDLPLAIEDLGIKHQINTEFAFGI